MRFLIVTQYFPPEIGAPQVRLAAVAKTLVERGHKVEVITGMPNYPTGKISVEYQRHFYMKEEWSGCRIQRIWLYAALGVGFRRMLNYLSFTFMVCVPLILARKSDVVLVESPPPFVMLPVVFFNLFWKAKLVLNVADLWPDSITQMGLMKEGIAVKIIRIFERWCYCRANYINAVTVGIRNSLIHGKNIPVEKVLFFPNGVDTVTFSPSEPDRKLASELGLDGKHVIVYAGTLGYAQGLEVALQAMIQVAGQLPTAHLVLIGDGSEFTKLTRMAKELTLNNVSFLRPQPPEYVARLYSIALAGLASLKPLPLFKGARPSKIFPIMASGKPVIYSGAGEGACLIQEADAGMVVEPGDASALAVAMEYIVRNPDVATKYGQNGRRFVERELSWTKIVDDWLVQLANSNQSTAASKVNH
ncbi:MAG: glycosyltransferase family 4 protein [Gammaproteobacteria bacterium]